MNLEHRHLLERLLRAIAEGPSAADLSQAPLLDPWQPILSRNATPHLWGRVSRHPHLGDTVITTSPLVAIDAGRGWARTVSRWYTLGTPFAEFAAEVSRSIGGGQGDVGRAFLELPGFVPLEDMDLLTELLARQTDQLRRILAQERLH